MRTTATLDDDTERIIRRRMQQQRVSFEQALNDLVREAHTQTAPPRKFQTRTASMGPPSVDLDKALALAGELEDAGLVAAG